MRKQIRDAVSLLLKNRTSVKDRVYTNRYTPLFDAELPCICIYFKKDLPRQRPSGCYFYRRDLSLILEVMVKPTNSMDDEMDAICLEIEDIILPNIFTKNPVTGTDTATFSDMGETDISMFADGNKMFASARMTFDLEYEQDIPEVKAGMVDFNSALVKFRDSDPHTGALPGASVDDGFTV